MERIVYVSTIGVFGNTHGEIVNETYHHDGNDFLSCYEETKYLSHEVALDRIARGAPIVIVQPGGVYGPGDHSELGNIIDQTRTGKLKMLMFAETGFNLVHVDDVAEGILLAHDRGKVGEAYVLGGEISTMGDLIRKVADVSGRDAPSRDDARVADEDGDPDRPGGREGHGLPAESARVDSQLGRGHLLGDR